MRGTTINLSTNLWSDGTCAPQGFRHCARFRLERGLPTWRWELDECTLEKRIAMVLGENVVVVEYRLLPGSAPCELHLEALINNRSHHTLLPNPAFDASTGRLSGVPAAADAGTYANIVIRVSDGTLSTNSPEAATSSRVSVEITWTSQPSSTQRSRTRSIDS